MKIGVQSAFSGATPPDLIADVGKIAEERGFHSLWVPEHVVFFSEYESQYPYSADGRIPGNPNGVMEPLTALTFVAAHTTTLRLGTGICLVPQRNPLYTARQTADLDYLSGGRLDFGVGVGWLREEFDALGVPWERRGARTRECIAVMKSAWCDEVTKFDGEFYSVPACLMNPKPVQDPHPPIFFGGESEAALQRVADVGQGWFGYNLTPQMVGELIPRLEKMLQESGRQRSDVQIYVSPRNGRLEDGMVEAFRDLGVDQVIAPIFSRDADGLRKRADALAEQTLQRL